MAVVEEAAVMAGKVAPVAAVPEATRAEALQLLKEQVVIQVAAAMAGQVAVHPQAMQPEEVGEVIQAVGLVQREGF
jgi:hypothetical protein